MKKSLIALIAVALLGVGCATTSNQNPPAQPSGKMSMAQFMTGSWKIKSMQQPGGVVQDVSSLGLTLDFDGSKMIGKVCNNMSGSYTVEDNLVKFGPVVSTKMFCEGLAGDAETAFTTGINNNLTISKQGEDLAITGGAVFVLERQGSNRVEDGKVY